MLARRHALAAAAMVLAGCAALRPPLAAPEVEIASVRVAEARLPRLTLAIELSVRNPNAVAIELAALDADLAIGGERVAVVRLARPVTLPPDRSTRITLTADADAGAALAGVGRVLGGGRPVGYELTGLVTLGDGTAYPFRRRGEIPVPGTAK